MAEELNGGAAYLAELKRSTAPQTAAAAPARAREVSSLTSDHSKNAAMTPVSSPVEKRRTPRYKCQGSAHLQEFNSSTSVWATLTDISMHGCYVEAGNTFRVGTILTVRLEAKGFRIDSSGDVRVAYPGLGMGISFGRMLEKDREQLRELLRSIQPSAILSPPVATRLQPESAADMWRVDANPSAALQAIFSFFENRHMMGREEFLRIVRNSQGNSG